MASQTSNGISIKRQRCKIPRSTYVQVASQMGLFCKGSTEKICKYRIKERERGFQKGVQETLSQIPEGFTIAVQDESIFVHDVITRRKLWLPKGIRPMVSVTGSHQRTCVFGTLTLYRRQLFRQYDC